MTLKISGPEIQMCNLAPESCWNLSWIEAMALGNGMGVLSVLSQFLRPTRVLQALMRKKDWQNMGACLL